MSNDGQVGPAAEDRAHPSRPSSPKPRKTDKWNTASAAWSCATDPSCLLRTSSVSTATAVKRARRPKPIASYARSRTTETPVRERTSARRYNSYYVSRDDWARCTVVARTTTGDVVISGDASRMCKRPSQRHNESSR